MELDFVRQRQLLGLSFQGTAERTVTNDMEFELYLVDQPSACLDEKVNALPIHQAPNKYYTGDSAYRYVCNRSEAIKVNPVFDKFPDLLTLNIGRKRIICSLVRNQYQRGPKLARH